MCYKSIHISYLALDLHPQREKVYTLLMLFPSQLVYYIVSFYNYSFIFLSRATYGTISVYRNLCRSWHDSYLVIDPLTRKDDQDNHGKLSDCKYYPCIQ